METKYIVVLVILFAVLLLTGCKMGLIKSDLSTTIIEYINKNGESKAIEYIDKLVKEGILWLSAFLSSDMRKNIF